MGQHTSQSPPLNWLLVGVSFFYLFIVISLIFFFLSFLYFLSFSLFLAFVLFPLLLFFLLLLFTFYLFTFFFFLFPPFSFLPLRFSRSFQLLLSQFLPSFFFHYSSFLFLFFLLHQTCSTHNKNSIWQIFCKKIQDFLVAKLFNDMSYFLIFCASSILIYCKKIVASRQN
jgi:hypothetical protein